MSTISAPTGVSLANARPISAGKPVAPTAAELEEINRRLKSEAEIAADTKIAQERTDAVKVHTVYRKGDKIIGVQYRNGWTSFASNGDADHRFDAEREGRAKGLKGDALTDYMANRMAETLKKQYGGIRVETYSASNAPTHKQISQEMFGAASERGASSPVSRINWTADTLELLSGS